MWCRIVLHTLCVEIPPLLSLSLTYSHIDASLSPLSFLSTRTVFNGAGAFDQDPLCGPSWVGSTAIKTDMFSGVKRGSIASTVCICAGGYWNSEQCIGCPVGKYNDGDGWSACKNCLSGRYSDEVGQTSCKQCPAGNYSDESAQTSCKQCAAGYYSDESAQTSCKQCAAGNYSDDLGQTLCKQCAEGQYLDEVAQTSCKTCRAGTYSSTRGRSTSCLECPSGTHLSLVHI